MPRLQATARAFARSMTANMEVAIAAFDGSADIHPLQSYTADPEVPDRAIDGITAFSKRKDRDASTNLYGAYIKGIESLEHKIRSASGQIARGVLVTVTDGTDQANRQTEAEARSKEAAATWQRKLSTWTIGVSGETNRATLEALAQGGGRAYQFKQGWAELTVKAVREIAGEIEKEGRSSHVLSYCSPKRAGQHKVTVRVKPSVARSGRASFGFDATGFGPGCDADAVLSDCNVVRCGGTCGGCPAGQTCRDFRCVQDAELQKAREEEQREARERQAAYEPAKAAAERRYRGCQAEHELAEREWAAYRPAYARYRAADCGFRIRLEGGLSLYPAPEGVAGAVLLGWSFPRWAEVAVGMGFWPAALIFETRVKPWTWRWLDLLVVPRVAVGLMQAPWTFEAEVLVGLRARIGRYFALDAQLGPGYARSHWGTERKQSFVFPGWLGAEVRF